MLSLFLCAWWLVPRCFAQEPDAPVPCATSVTVQSFLTLIAAGEEAFVNIDKPLVRDRRDAAVQELRCMNEPIGTTEAARLHRLDGLVAFLEKDRERATRAFAVAQALEPHYIWPEGLVPSGHPILKLYESANALAPTPQTEVVAAPLGGFVTIDGVRTSERRLGEAAIIQVMDAKNGIVDSRYLAQGEALPNLDLSQYDMDLSRPALRSIFKAEPKPWIVATTTGLLVSAALYGAAMYERGRFEDTDNPVPDNDLPSVQSAANTLGIAWIGASALTAATAVVTFTVVIPNHRREATHATP